MVDMISQMPETTVDGATMLVQARRITDRVQSPPWENYRANLERALRAYRGTHKGDVEALINRYFPQAATRNELIADVTNFVRKPVNRAASLWSTPVQRSYLSADNQLDEESSVVEVLNKQNRNRTQALIRLDRRSYLFGSAFLNVGWNARKERLAYRVISPADVWIVQGSEGDQDDVQNLDALIYKLAGSSEINKYCLWTKEYQLIYEAASVDSPERILPDPSGNEWRNPLGLLPFVVAREEDPEGVFFPAYSEDLVDIALRLNLIEAIQERNIWYQGFAPMIVPEGTETRQVWGPNVAWQEPAEFVGQTRFLTKDTPFEEITAHIERRLRTIALTKDLPPNDFAFDSKAPESGFAKLIDSLSLIALRDARIGQVGHPVEEELVAVEGRVLSFYGYPVPSDISVNAQFSNISFPKSDEEKANEAAAQIAANLTNPARILAKQKGISYEEALEEVEENRRVNELREETNERPEDAED